MGTENDEPGSAKPVGGESAADAATLDQSQFDADALVHEAPGTQIGPYKLIQRIGEGGFGSVFLAEQERPVRRRVALKIIKLGMDTRQVVARFEQERQALAVLDHPNIAKVFDAGATETGRPYFVMELCTGEPIDEYCDRHRLGIDQRLELFAQVCLAVQHAHTKGLIHRDIKPSNVLVSTQDDKPHAKVIDFGIAKATANRLTEKTLFTSFSQMVGTPEYMSPEQAEGSFDIDTRTDVYALGVMLYELLTGTTPFDSKSLRSAAYAEIQRIIREVDPPRPSTRLSENNETIASVAACRQTQPRKLGLTVRGELDWIVMKCLEKDRTRRYETANGLAMDVRRYLNGEAVVAAPPSTVYRLRKFVRRHRLQVAAAALVALALVLGLAGTMWEARIARDQAIAAKKSAEEAKTARDSEKARADELKKVSDFQKTMLAEIDTNKAGADLMSDVRDRYAAALEKDGVAVPARTTRANAFRAELARVNATDTAAEMIDRTILKPAIRTIDERFKDQPVVDAKLRQTLADLYEKLGRYDDAMPLQENALTTRRRILGAEQPDTLTSINNMGVLLLAQGKLAEAQPYLREALEKMRRVLGEEQADTLQSINNMGALLQAQGKLTEAEPYYREALEKRRRVLGEEQADTLQSINNMGALLQAQGKLAEAEPYWREALEKSRRVLGEEHPSTLDFINNMGALLEAQGKLAEAERYSREALEKMRRVLGEEHPATLRSINSMGNLLQSQGKLAEAEPYYREALEKRRRVLGEEHPSTLTSINNLGTLIRAQGKLAEAEPYYREALEKRRRVLGEENLETLQSINNLGVLLNAQGKLAEAEPYLREALEKRRRVLGEEHPRTLMSINNMGSLLDSQGKLTEAEPYYREALEKFRRVLGEEHPDTLRSINNLGILLRAQGKLAEAIDLLAPAEGAARKAFTGANAANLATLLTILGRSRAALPFDPARFALAETNLLEAHSAYTSTLGESHKGARTCAEALADLYAAWEKAEPGRGYGTKAAEWKAKLDAWRATTRPATSPVSTAPATQPSAGSGATR